MKRPTLRDKLLQVVAGGRPDAASRPAGLLQVLLTAALLLAIVMSLGATSQTSLEYWYFLAAPALLASWYFGTRGALLMSGLSFGIILGLLSVTGKHVDQSEELAKLLVALGPDTLDAPLLVDSVRDLLLAGIHDRYAHAFVGTSLIAVGSLLLGGAVDRRKRATVALQRATSEFRRYVSPKIMAAIVDPAGDVDPRSFSARKEVTLLFADLRGFSSISERLDAEDVVAMLNEFFEAMTAEVLRHGGTLDKYIGDEIMAFFGDTDAPMEDDAVRAASCAIAMQQRMRELNGQWRSQGREVVELGIGISTGISILGTIGSSHYSQYTAVGNTVNIASRLADLAKPGQILATQKTYCKIQTRLSGQTLKPVSIKGIQAPIAVVEVLGHRIVTQQDASPARSPAAVIERVVTDARYRALLLRDPDAAQSVLPLSPQDLSLACQAARLAGYALFRDLPPAELAWALALATLEECPQGGTVMRQGDRDQRLLVILEGEVVVTVLDTDGDERHVATLAKGDLFGETAFVGGGLRSANVQATLPSTFLVLHQHEAAQLAEHAPNLLRRARLMAEVRANRPEDRELNEYAERARAVEVASN